MLIFKRCGWYIFILYGVNSALVTVHINSIEVSLKETVEVDTSKENDYNMYTIAKRETLDDKQMSAYSIILWLIYMS